MAGVDPGALASALAHALQGAPGQGLHIQVKGCGQFIIYCGVNVAHAGPVRGRPKGSKNFKTVAAAAASSGMYNIMSAMNVELGDAGGCRCSAVPCE